MIHVIAYYFWPFKQVWWGCSTLLHLKCNMVKPNFCVKFNCLIISLVSLKHFWTLSSSYKEKTGLHGCTSQYGRYHKAYRKSLMYIKIHKCFSLSKMLWKSFLLMDTPAHLSRLFPKYFWWSKEFTLKVGPLFKERQMYPDCFSLWCIHSLLRGLWLPVYSSGEQK